jgi:DnaJ-class molecular chaperone
MTHYDVLNVSEKASAAVIKSTYRLLMKAFHQTISPIPRTT